MPELPEAERARAVLEGVLGRTIVRVEDSDSYVCRPHAPGEIADALAGHRLMSARRRGKFLWMETADGPVLGLHLGMAGRIVVDGMHDTSPFDRFAIEFDDGIRMALTSAASAGPS
jgi:formamidopyrimidine-DNA glycosylase